MPEFIQVITLSTSRFDELSAIMDEWRARTEGKRTATSAVVTADRDTPNRYVQIVRFPSYEEAMRNSELPETQELSARIAELCDGPPTFLNLDVQRDDQT